MRTRAVTGSRTRDTATTLGRASLPRRPRDDAVARAPLPALLAAVAQAALLAVLPGGGQATARRNAWAGMSARRRPRREPAARPRRRWPRPTSGAYAAATAPAADGRRPGASVAAHGRARLHARSSRWRRAVFRAPRPRASPSAASEHVPRTGGAVMAINHVGYLDFTFAGLAAQPAGRLVRFMAKKEVFDHRVSGPLMRGMKHIPVDRLGAPADELRRAPSRRCAAARSSASSPRRRSRESLRAQGVQDRRGAHGERGRRAAAAVRHLGQPADLHQGPAARTSPAARRSASSSASRSCPTPGADPVAVTAELKRRMQRAARRGAGRRTPAARARPTTPGGSRARLGGTAPTIEQARRCSPRRTQERADRRPPGRGAVRGDGPPEPRPH